MKNSILIAEDDEGLAKQLQKSLEKEGYHTDQVYKGGDAINHAIENPNTLMLLDYFLPDMTCKKVIEELNNRQCRVNFVIITAYGDEKFAVDMMKLGAIDYIVKGLNFIDLVPAIVERAIKQINSERKLAEAQEKLIVSEKKLSYIMNSLGEGVLEIDKELNITFANTEVERLLGWKKDELIGENFHKKVHCMKEDESPLPYEECAAIKAFQTGKKFRNLRAAFVAKDKKIITVMLTTTAVVEKGKVKGVVILFHEIAERKLN